MSTTLLSVSNLTKKYGSFTAVDGVSFSIEPGEVVGLLGANGAGKTTTIQMLLGITLPTSGAVSYLGKDLLKHRSWCLQQINYASAYNTLLGRITVLENLLVFAGLYEVKNARKKIDELLEYFEITKLANQAYIDLSAGERTRVNLVKSLVNDPKLILMDEPTASLDPDISDKTLALIEDLRDNRSLSILYTSHEMAEVERICDQVIFLDHGKIVMHDTPLNLTSKVKRFALVLNFRGTQRDIGAALGQNEVTFPFAHVAEIQTTEPEVSAILAQLHNRGVVITGIEIKKPTLEDVFLQVARGSDESN